MRAPAPGPAMIGRDADLRLLDEAFSDACTGVARCVVIGGEAGMGKSRLLTEFAVAVRSTPSDALVLTAECLDLGALGVPLGPIRAILRQLADAVGADKLLAASGFGRPALAAVLPELANGAETGEEPLHETLVSLLRTFSRDRPIVMLLDDAQWIDADSLAVMRYLLRTVSSERVLVVIAYRTEDAGRTHPLRRALAELDQARVITRRELHGLEHADVRALLTRLRGTEPDRETVERVSQRSQGVPFFVEELVWLGADGISDTLRDVLLTRYERVDASAQALLRVLAVGGMEVSHDVLREVAGAEVDAGALDAGALDASARVAADANLLISTEGGYAFRHALVREAVFEELLAGERQRLHERYATVLSAAGAPASEISFHWLAAHNLPLALSSAVVAFDQAVTDRAYASALQLGERALELWEKVPDAGERAARSRALLLTQVTTAAIDAGDRARGLSWIAEALAFADPSDRRARVELLRTKASLLGEEGHPGGEEALGEALAILGDDESDLVLRARVQLSLSGRYDLTGRMDAARKMLGSALDTARRSGDDEVIASALHRLSWLVMLEGDVERSAELLAESRTHAQDGVALLLFGTNVSDAYVQIGEFRAALEVAERPIQRARELGLERSWGGSILSNSVDALLALGLWDEAEKRGQEVLSIQPSGCSIASQHRRRIVMASWQDDTPRATAIAREHSTMLRTFEARGDLQDVLSAAFAMGELAFFEGDLDEAWRRVSLTWDPVHDGATGYDLPLLGLAARLVAEFRRLGRPVPADAVDNIQATFARAASWPIVPRWRSFVDAELSGSEGTGTDVGAWARAAEALSDDTMPAHLRAYAFWRLGQAQLAAGDRVAAGVSLRSAEDQATRIGASWISGRARDLLQTAGLGDRPRGHQDRLTARERQVLDLVAEGLTNREISQRLFISGKTTSTHVSAILRKLGATTRTQAAMLGATAA